MIFQPPFSAPTARHEAQVLDHSQAERDEGYNDGWSLYRRMQILFSLKGLIITFVNRAAVLMSLECCVTGRGRVLFQKALSLNRDCIQASIHYLPSSCTSAGARVVSSLSEGHSKPKTACLGAIHEQIPANLLVIICHTRCRFTTYEEVIYISGYAADLH